MKAVIEMYRFTQSYLRVFLSCAILFSAGCATEYGLVMSSTKELVNQGASSPELAGKGYRHALLIPPTAGKFVDYADLVARWDTTVIKAGLVSVPSIHTATLRNAATQLESAAGQQSLADAMKAIRDAGTDVAVAIVSLEWSEKETPSRFFVLDESTDQTTFEEVEPVDYGSWTGPKYSFNSPVLSFAAKIYDVATTEILGTIQVQAPANWTLPSDYKAQLALEGDQWVVTQGSFDYSGKVWIPAAKTATEDRILQLIVETIGASAAAEKSPGAAETESSSAPEK
jgi:hypothetical protein